MTHKFLCIVAIFFVIMLVALNSFTLLALAQEAASFEIRVIPQSEYAVVGQPFTYTIAVTNTSQNPVEDVFVKVKIPKATTYAGASTTDLQWFGGNPFPGTSVEEIIWFSPEPVSPGERVLFELVVAVEPETTEQELINEEYVVTKGERPDDVLASGPPVKTRLLAVESTPTTVPAPSPTSSPAPINIVPSPTLTAQANPTAGRTAPSPTARPIARVSPDVARAATPIPKETTQATVSQLPSFMLALATICLVLLLIVGLFWFSRRA